MSLRAWAIWAEYVWYMILALALIWEVVGISTTAVPTLSDLIQALVRHWGWFGRITATLVLIWLIYHFVVEPFRAILP